MGQFADAIKSFQVRSLAAAEAVRKDVIMSSFGNIIFDTPVDTGRLTANWMTSQNAPDLSPIWWNEDKRNHTPSEREANQSAASAVAYASLLNNIGEGLKRDTVTYLSNSAQSNKHSEDGPGNPYGFKAEFGYKHYAWNARNGLPPPSENVLASGFSQWAPKGMVRINVAKFHEVVRKAVRKHA
jgi:hypothetical protein